MPGAAEPLTCRGLYLELCRAFEAAGFPGAALEARELLCAGTCRTREALLRDEPLTREEAETVRALAERHLAGEPVAYLIGEWAFYGLPLTVTPAVLIPRVDTEVLAGEAIAFLEAQGPCRALDLCAGSGCVGLALADQVPACRVVLGELSTEALAVCGENVRRCGLENRAEVRRLDALRPPPEDLGRFSCIVCNPPYIPDGDIPDLDGSVRDFEPHMALRGGADGLDFYRAIVRDWRRVLLPGGRLYFEVGIGQAEAVRALLDAGGFTGTAVMPDGQGIDRVVSGAVPGT